MNRKLYRKIYSLFLIFLLTTSLVTMSLSTIGHAEGLNEEESNTGSDVVEDETFTETEEESDTGSEVAEKEIDSETVEDDSGTKTEEESDTALATTEKEIDAETAEDEPNTFSDDDDRAIFKLAGGDSTPPVLESVEISPKEVNVGDTITIKAKISDDLSGVNFANVSFKSPSEERTQGIILSENADTGYWEGSYVVQDYDESGEWELWYIAVNDNAGNSKSYLSNEIETNINFIINKSNDDSSGEEDGSDNDGNEELPYHIVTSNETWSNKVINNDVFIGPEA